MVLAGQLTLPQSFSRAGLKHVEPKLGKLQAVARTIIERWQQPDYVQVQLSLWGCTTALPTANEVAQVAVHLALHTTAPTLRKRVFEVGVPAGHRDCRVTGRRAQVWA